MKCYELKPYYDRAKSFYKKAYVAKENDMIMLISYSTVVCEITPTGEFVRVWGGYSATTARHINEFRQQFGFEPINKAQWLDL